MGMSRREVLAAAAVAGGAAVLGKVGANNKSTGKDKIQEKLKQEDAIQKKLKKK